MVKEWKLKYLSQNTGDLMAEFPGEKYAEKRKCIASSKQGEMHARYFMNLNCQSTRGGGWRK